MAFPGLSELILAGTQGVNAFQTGQSEEDQRLAKEERQRLLDDDRKRRQALEHALLTLRIESERKDLSAGPRPPAAFQGFPDEESYLDFLGKRESVITEAQSDRALNRASVPSGPPSASERRLERDARRDKINTALGSVMIEVRTAVRDGRIPGLDHPAAENFAVHLATSRNPDLSVGELRTAYQEEVFGGGRQVQTPNAEGRSSGTMDRLEALAPPPATAAGTRGPSTASRDTATATDARDSAPGVQSTGSVQLTEQDQQEIDELLGMGLGLAEILSLFQPHEIEAVRAYVGDRG